MHDILSYRHDGNADSLPVKSDMTAVDPIVFQLKEHDQRARTAYRCTAARWFDHYVAWENLTTAERDYWRTHVE